MTEVANNLAENIMFQATSFQGLHMAVVSAASRFLQRWSGQRHIEIKKYPSRLFANPNPGEASKALILTPSWREKIQIHNFAKGYLYKIEHNGLSWNFTYLHEIVENFAILCLNPRRHFQHASPRCFSKMLPV